MASKGKFYISTPIYYPSDNLHIGHTYCTVMADAMARFKRAQGYDVRFQTGTDEHGQKIQKIALENGVTPIEYVDKIVGGVKKLWDTMEISYDDFVRTTEPRHMKRVQDIFMKMYEAGDIYKGRYEGLYCTPCESFWTENQLVDGCCPDCGRPVEKASEEAYFFKLSKYAPALLKNFKENPDFLQPEARRNEMIAFIEQGLDDLCISRTSFDWGIPVPIDPKHVIYVWLDALTNYVTTLGFPDDDCPEYDKWWPADYHLVGKEIVRFHSIIWPAMLMSLKQPLPKHVLGHGWLLIDGGKMSKSKGNIVDPVMLINRYGVDALKYFLLREYTFGQDGVFTNEVMVKRLNYDLANDLGNLVSRTVSMIEKYCGGVIPKAGKGTEHDEDLKEISTGAVKKIDAAMDDFKFNVALEELWVVIRRANKYIDETAPWVLAKDEANKEVLDTVLHNLAETMRIVSILLFPFMHNTADKIKTQFGIIDEKYTWEDTEKWDMLGGEKVKKGDPIFPRLDIDKELAELEAIGAEQRKKAQEKLKAQEEAGKKLEAEKNGALKLKDEIEYDDFDKLDLRVGTILECKKHPDADHLLVFQVKMGTETRQIISGVAEWYKPEDCIGQKVVVVANLKPRKLRGLESKGMLLFADNEVDGKMKCEFVETAADDGNPVT